MKCNRHPDADATAICLQCGRALCPECAQEINDEIYCKTGPCAEKREKRVGYQRRAGGLAQIMGLVFIALGILAALLVGELVPSLFSIFAGLIVFIYGLFLEKQAKL
ncbi:MAG: B-box zinc finger protein [Chloroflexi bacterium]|nr:B-box zinc finger protein [Chloroflexota bacterium]